MICTYISYLICLIKLRGNVTANSKILLNIKWPRSPRPWCCQFTALVTYNVLRGHCPSTQCRTMRWHQMISKASWNNKH